MKKPSISRKQKIFIGIVIAVLVVLGIGIFVKKESIHRRYEGFQLRRQLNTQLNPLKDSLAQLGFKDLPKPKTDCSYPPAGPQDRAPSRVLNCSVSINKYIVVGKNAKLSDAATALSKQLTANGWQQRKDFPTISWFQAIEKGIDYQPDQLNVKQFDDMTCTVDFFTAYSKPAPPAISLQASCYKPKIPNFLGS